MALIILAEGLTVRGGLPYSTARVISPSSSLTELTKHKRRAQTLATIYRALYLFQSCICTMFSMCCTAGLVVRQSEKEKACCRWAQWQRTESLQKEGKPCIRDGQLSLECLEYIHFSCCQWCCFTDRQLLASIRIRIIQNIIQKGNN